jgi:hypothetical protein
VLGQAEQFRQLVAEQITLSGKNAERPCNQGYRTHFVSKQDIRPKIFHHKDVRSIVLKIIQPLRPSSQQHPEPL